MLGDSSSGGIMRSFSFSLGMLDYLDSGAAVGEFWDRGVSKLPIPGTRL